MELYFSATPNLFDGMEMLEVLLQDKNNVMDEEMKIAILTAVVVFFLFSFLELFEVKYVENESTPNSNWCWEPKWPNGFQIVLNAVFLGVCLALWFAYDQDAAIFITKNVISLFYQILPYLEKCGWVSTKSKQSTNESCIWTHLNPECLSLILLSFVFHGTIWIWMYCISSASWDNCLSHKCVYQ